MQIRLDVLNEVFSRALDIIEKELVGVSDRHSVRVALLCAMMGRKLGLDEDAVCVLSVCALFHDNALTEYMLSERAGRGGQKVDLGLHCTYGQRNIECLPFKSGIDGFVLYHHERADGKGPFGKKEGEFPLEAAIIAMADAFDLHNHLQKVPVEDLPVLRQKIKSLMDDGYAVRRVGESLLAVLDAKALKSLKDDVIEETALKEIPRWTIDADDPAIVRIAGFVARIIDYKSEFTQKHTIQIANKAWLMAGYYGFSQTEKVKLYLAASLHDIGKIAIPLSILEKPGYLNDDEFAVIKEHVLYTYQWLSKVSGLEDVCRWASEHHEKLNGSGYSFGKTLKELDFNSRLIACLDIYQAVSEPRPYHGARSHYDTIKILREMNGLIDMDVINDIDKVLAAYSGQDVPEPAVF